jgi:NAD(P)H-dependent FMN reductase
MTNLMIIVGSVRTGRVGLPVAEWVRKAAEKHGGFEIDFVDLKELGLPFMDEPHHPRLREYTQQHTRKWSARVEAADSFILVTPEYNYSYSPALKNAIDYLHQEWWRKPVGFVSYGGMSAGTRGTAALAATISAVGLVRTGAAVEMSFVGTQISDGVFSPSEKQAAILSKVFDELPVLSEALRPLR